MLLVLLVLRVFLVIMTSLGVVIVMPGLFGVNFGAAAVTVLIFERDRLYAFGRHHPDTLEVRSVDQTVQPAFKL